MNSPCLGQVAYPAPFFPDDEEQPAVELIESAEDLWDGDFERDEGPEEDRQ